MASSLDEEAYLWAFIDSVKKGDHMLLFAILKVPQPGYSNRGEYAASHPLADYKDGWALVTAAGNGN